MGVKINPKALTGAGAAILAMVFAMEGGYINNPKDPGGETNMGMTKAVAVSKGYTGPMKTIPKDIVASIYYDDYLVKPGFEPMLDIQPAIAKKLVDEAVNMGPSRPSIWFQKSLNALNRDTDYANIPEDGKVGTGTIEAYKGLEKKRGKYGACVLTLKLLDAQQAVYYMSLKGLKTFTPGWIDNRITNVSYSSCIK